MSKFDLNLVEEQIELGNVRRQKHPTMDLYIYNYTPQCQYKKNWNRITMMCRGLIADGSGKVIARPFKKFFNLGEHQGVPHGEFTVTEKMDGSLGILYWADNKPKIATRGSFTSPQALYATKLLETKYKDNIPNLIKWHTYLFEIIYPANRIVVDYEGREELVLLAVVDTNTGKEYPMKEEYGFPIVNHPDLKCETLYDMSKLNLPNKEGFVLKWENGERIKIKFEEYARLHRLVTGVSSKTIWEYLYQGMSIKELIERVPDEFYEWVIKTKQDLQMKYATIESIALQEYDEVKHIKLDPDDNKRKQQALYINKNCKYPSILFKLLDGQDYSEIIWKLIKPTYECPFKNQEEEI